MKTLGGILLALILIVVLAGVVAYAVGRSLPVDHAVSVSGTVAAPPAKVFALITDVASAPKWRHALKGVEVLPPEQGRDHWIEDLGHGQTMNFHATRTEPVDATGHGLREVLLNDPSYGGSWTYVLSPGSSPQETALRITETGYINPPIYRFMMAHVFGPTRNLDQYMSDIKAAAGRS